MLLFRVRTHGQLVQPMIRSITSDSFLCPIKPNQLAVSCCLFDEKSHGPMSKTASIPISSSCYKIPDTLVGASTTNIAEATWDRTTTDSRVVRGTQGPLGGEIQVKCLGLKNLGQAQCQPCRKCIPLHMYIYIYIILYIYIFIHWYSLFCKSCLTRFFC